MPSGHGTGTAASPAPSSRMLTASVIVRTRLTHIVACAQFALFANVFLVFRLYGELQADRLLPFGHTSAGVSRGYS